MLRVAVCVSGGGTNLQAIIDAIKNGKIQNTQIVRVISNNKNAYALKRAEAAGIEGVCVSPRDFDNRELFNNALLKSLKEADPAFQNGIQIASEEDFLPCGCILNFKR